MHAHTSSLDHTATPGADAQHFNLAVSIQPRSADSVQAPALTLGTLTLTGDRPVCPAFVSWSSQGTWPVCPAFVLTIVRDVSCVFQLCVLVLAGDRPVCPAFMHPDTMGLIFPRWRSASEQLHLLLQGKPSGHPGACPV